MKIKIEVNVPDSVDLEHAIESISDATFVADNVTQAEANLVFSMQQNYKLRRIELLKPTSVISISHTRRHLCHRLPHRLRTW